MIIGNCYPSDDNEELMMYQHDCYYDCLRHWIRLAGERHCWYHRLPEWEDISRQWDKFRENGYHDHRTIQAHHDLIAQRYRQIQDNPPYIMFLGKNGWFDFFISEIRKLMENPELLRLFMTVLAYSNTRPGYDAEEALLDKMRERYRLDKYNQPVANER